MEATKWTGILTSAFDGRWGLTRAPSFSMGKGIGTRVHALDPTRTPGGQMRLPTASLREEKDQREVQRGKREAHPPNGPPARPQFITA